MFTVELNELLLENMRNHAKQFYSSEETSNLAPELAEHLRSLIADAETSWRLYCQRKNTPINRAEAFQCAVTSITLLTLAFELVREHFWVVRKTYCLPLFSQLSSSHYDFTKASNDAMALATNMIIELNHFPNPTSAAACAAYAKGLHCCLHIEKVMLEACRTAERSENKWQTLTSALVAMHESTRRNLAALYSLAARFRTA